MVKQHLTGNQNPQEKYVITFLIIIGGLFIISFGLLFYRSLLLDEEFPKLSKKNSLNDTVLFVMRDGRSSARVTFRNRKKYSLPFARNHNYLEYSDLSRVIEAGDVIIKEQFSDTIIVNHFGRNYLFIAEKSIR